MSETEGLAKLTEYLKQTRRQAEIAIDNLNSQLLECRKENEALRMTLSNLQKERDSHLTTIQQLKTENGAKWKFKERDEWKALVENIQKDRDRIQLEYNNVSAYLEESQIELARTKQDLSLLGEEYRLVKQNEFQLQEHIQQLQLELQQRDNNLDKTTNTTLSSPSGESKASPLLMSPVFDRRGRNILASLADDDEKPLSPRSAAYKLKDELRRTNEQVTEELAIAERELQLRDLEIHRLASELNREQQMRQFNLQNPTIPLSDSLHFGSVVTLVADAEDLIQRREQGIFDVLLSFFSYSPSQSFDQDTLSGENRVIKV